MRDFTITPTATGRNFIVHPAARGRKPGDPYFPSRAAAEKFIEGGCQEPEYTVVPGLERIKRVLNGPTFGDLYPEVQAALMDDDDPENQD